jgi:hypothetical protein
MFLPCKHTTPRDGCRICWLSQNDERYAQLWSADVNARKVAYAPAPDRSPGLNPDQLEMLRKIKLHMSAPCQHLGEALEAKPSCGCGGTLAILHVCGRHDRCRISSRDQSNRNCITCDDYKPRAKDEN